MRFGGGKKVSKTFVRFVTAFLLMLTLPMTFALVAFFSYLQTYRGTVQEMHTATLNRNLSAVDDVLVSVDHFVYQLSENATVRKLMQSGSAGDVDIGTLQGLGRQLPLHNTFSAATGNTVLHTLLFFPKSGLFICDTNVYFTANWTEDFEVCGYPLSAWQNCLSIADTGTRYLPGDVLTARDGRQPGFILQVTSLPMGRSGVPEAYVVLCLGTEALERQLLDGVDRAAVAFSLQDENGIELLAGGGQTGERPVEFSLRTYNGWQCTWQLSRAYVESEPRQMMGVIIAGAVLLLAAGVGIALLLAWRQNKPVREISRILSDNSAGADQDYPAIRDSIRRLIAERNNLENALRQGRSSVRSYLLERLLLGGDLPDGVVAGLADSAGFAASGSGWLVLAVQVTGPGESIEKLADIQVQQSLLHNFIVSRPGEVLVQNIGVDTVVVIHRDAGRARDYGEKLAVMLRQKGHLNVLIGMGTPCASPGEFYLSYQVARAALKRGPKNGMLCLPPAEGEGQGHGRLQYSLEDEQRLVHAVHSGSAGECAALLDKIGEANRQGTTPEVRGLLIQELKAALYRLLLEEDPAELAGAGISTRAVLLFAANGDFERDFALMREHYQDACQYFSRRRRSSTNDLLKSIVGYLEESYTDQQLSLGVIAEHFSLSEAYISHLFKQYTGENFTACLERIRMNRAHKLLSDSTLSIESIAGAVGYHSDDTFRRAFKRYHGITPVVYRMSTKKPDGDDADADGPAE